MTKRVIQPIPTGITFCPWGVFWTDGNGQTYVDYLTDAEVPADAVYAAEMTAPGQLNVLVSPPDGFVWKHHYAGWSEDQNVVTTDAAQVAVVAAVDGSTLIRVTPDQLAAVQAAVVDVAVVVQPSPVVRMPPA